MGSFLGHKAKDITEISDEIIIDNMLASAAAAANAYLNATLTSSTPELRALYGDGMNQIIGGHSAFSQLAINKGWQNPYNSPTQRLTDVYEKSKTTVEKEE